MTDHSPTSSGAASYVGRFAPSPTGPLHMGSLIAALASYLDARSQKGRWLLRMEDLDPPREPAGAADTILRQLDELHLHWDGEVLYQSQRHAAYREALARLSSAGHTFACTCTRKRLRSLDSVYDGHCRTRTDLGEKKHAVRLRVTPGSLAFTDRIQGQFQQQLDTEVGDFVVRRKDGLFAYQLAVVVDDAFQHVTDIVRGYDLLDSTPRQLYLQGLLGYPRPHYAHIPVIVNSRGEKLSKQRFAEPINVENGARLLLEALRFLGQRPPAELAGADCPTLLAWATEHWDIQAVPKLANIPEIAG
ncbi:MAG: tRNA glutamyl-Q(34) synthetase GluQRS [Pseudohongiellaceae bacterium]